MTMQREQHAPKSRGPHNAQHVPILVSMTEWCKEEKSSNGPCQRKEAGTDPKKTLMLTKTLVSEITDQVLLVDQ